jgi:hypothetical protein
MSSTTEPQSEYDSAGRAAPGLQTLRIVTISRAGQFLDAHVTASQDFAVVTRSPQPNNTQRWLLTNLSSTSSSGPYTIQQLSNGRYLDAYVTAAGSFRAVTRPKQDNTTQHWFFESGGGQSRIMHRNIMGRALTPTFDPPDFPVFTSGVGSVDQEWEIIDAELLVD